MGEGPDVAKEHGCSSQLNGQVSLKQPQTHFIYSFTIFNWSAGEVHCMKTHTFTHTQTHTCADTHAQTHTHTHNNTWTNKHLHFLLHWCKKIIKKLSYTIKFDFHFSACKNCDVTIELCDTWSCMMSLTKGTSVIFHTAGGVHTHFHNHWWQSLQPLSSVQHMHHTAAILKNLLTQTNVRLLCWWSKVKAWLPIKTNTFKLHWSKSTFTSRMQRSGSLKNQRTQSKVWVLQPLLE